MTDPVLQILRERLRAREAARFRERHAAVAAVGPDQTRQRALLDVGEARPDLAPAKTGTISGTMVALGWTRSDPRPWGKLHAHWIHRSGWELVHCNHPTANYPWDLRDPDGYRIRSGAMVGNAAFGTAWRSLLEAATFVDQVLSGKRAYINDPDAAQLDDEGGARTLRRSRSRRT